MRSEQDMAQELEHALDDAYRVTCCMNPKSSAVGEYARDLQDRLRRILEDLRDARIQDLSEGAP